MFIHHELQQNQSEKVKILFLTAATTVTA